MISSKCEAEIRPYNGRPTVFIDGEPILCRAAIGCTSVWMSRPSTPWPVIRTRI